MARMYGASHGLIMAQTYAPQNMRNKACKHKLQLLVPWQPLSSQKAEGCTKGGRMHKSRRDAQKAKGCTKGGRMHKSRRDAQKAEGCTK
eukprot:1148325-Pelagomonas_calceolata.AAC.1